MNNLFLTTPIFYPNDVPHIGHAYTTILADILARYHRLFGGDVFFMTGLDCHGQKIQEAADKRAISPDSHVNEMKDRFCAVWEKLNITYDRFMMTTEPYHKEVVSKCLAALYEKGDIYKASYEGWYCVSEEIFYPEKDLIDGKTPSGKDVVKITESNYFFKMGSYQQQLIDYINANPKFIYPESRRNEVLGFLKQPLEDLCISRPKSRLSWGVDLPFDPDFVTYVWFDALLNYPSGLGYLSEDSTERHRYEKLWGDTIHIIGKDILMTHCVYWPTMLMALEIPLPRRIVAHGWWLNSDGGKMSKSEGKVIRPLDMVDVVGVEPLRYFLARGMRLGLDASFSPDEVIKRVSADLANNLGNLVSRSLSLVAKYCGDTLPEQGSIVSGINLGLDTLITSVKTMIVDDLTLDLALEKVFLFLNDVNKYFNDAKPWSLLKSEETRENGLEVLRTTLVVIDKIAQILSPVMPEKMAELARTIHPNSKSDNAASSNWQVELSVFAAWGQKWAGEVQPLFPKDYEI